jgi:hypothetical protein
MTLRRIRRLGAGDSLTAAEQNRVTSAARASQFVEGSGLLAGEGGETGITITDNRPIPILARITGGTNPYSWVQSNETQAPGFPDAAGGFAMSGTTTVGQAYEVNGLQTVPVGTKVMLTLRPTLDSYEFVYPQPTANQCETTGGISILSETVNPTVCIVDLALPGSGSYLIYAKANAHMLALGGGTLHILAYVSGPAGDVPIYETDSVAAQGGPYSFEGSASFQYAITVDSANFTSVKLVGYALGTITGLSYFYSAVLGYVPLASQTTNVNCAACTIESGSGSGSGSGAGTYDCIDGVCTLNMSGTGAYPSLAACIAAGCGTGCSGNIFPPDDTNCCPGVCWPRTLHLTISGVCSQLNGTYTLTWNGSTGWTGTSGIYSIIFSCISGSGMGGVLTGSDGTDFSFSNIPDCTTPSVSGTLDGSSGSAAITGGPCAGTTTGNWSVM